MREHGSLFLFLAASFFSFSFFFSFYLSVCLFASPLSLLTVSIRALRRLSLFRSPRRFSSGIINPATREDPPRSRRLRAWEHGRGAATLTSIDRPKGREGGGGIVKRDSEDEGSVYLFAISPRDKRVYICERFHLDSFRSDFKNQRLSCLDCVSLCFTWKLSKLLQIGVIY